MPNFTHTDYGYEDEYEGFKHYAMELSGMALACLISAIVMFVCNGFLMIVLFLNRQSYRKSKLFTVLNYLLNYAMFALLYYLYMVHIHIYPQIARISCRFIIFIFIVLEDGTKYFIFPVCIDFIIQHFRPNLHEKRKFVYLELILIGGIWGIIFIKEIALSLNEGNDEIPFCMVMLSDVVIWAQIVSTILFLCVVVIFLGLLLYIAIKNGQSLWKSFNELGATALIIILLIITHVLSVLSIIKMRANIDSSQSGPASVSPYVHFICSLLIPFAWLCDGSIRQNIRKLFTGKRVTTENQPELELTTEIQ